MSITQGTTRNRRINTNPDCKQKTIRISSFSNTINRLHLQSARSDPQWMAIVKITNGGDSAGNLERNKKRPYTGRRKKVLCWGNCLIQY